MNESNVADIGHILERLTFNRPKKRPTPAELAAIAGRDPWRALSPTDRQRAVLVELGTTVPELRGQASDLISQLVIEYGDSK